MINVEELADGRRLQGTGVSKLQGLVITSNGIYHPKGEPSAAQVGLYQHPHHELASTTCGNGTTCLRGCVARASGGKGDYQPGTTTREFQHYDAVDGSDRADAGRFGCENVRRGARACRRNRNKSCTLAGLDPGHQWRVGDRQLCHEGGSAAESGDRAKAVILTLTGSGPRLMLDAAPRYLNLKAQLGRRLWRPIFLVQSTPSFPPTTVGPTRCVGYDRRRRVAAAAAARAPHPPRALPSRARSPAAVEGIAVVGKRHLVRTGSRWPSAQPLRAGGAALRAGRQG